MKQKKKIFSLLLASLCAVTFAQEVQHLSLQECLDQVVMEHPISKQHDLHTQLKNFKEENLNADLLPQFSINGKASIQNEVISLPQALAGVNLPSLSKDQYRLSMDLSQTIYRGGVTEYLKEMDLIALEIYNLTTDKELYEIKSVAKNYFFQILILDKQRQIVQSYQKLLNEKYKEIDVWVKEGIALGSSLDNLSIELINLSQELNAIHINKIALINKLKSLTHSELGEHTNFIMPSSTVLDAQDQVRYEYKLLSKKQQQLESSKSLLDSKTKPMLFAFATAGLGKPGLNMLSNQFDDFYMVGLNLKWDLWDWNKTKKDKKMVDISKAIIETQKQAFEMNIKLGLIQIQSEIDKQNDLIKDDPEIIVLREHLLQTAEAQFKNGSIRSSDYIEELQKLTQAKLNYEIHKITLLSAQLAYTEILGKL